MINIGIVDDDIRTLNNLKRLLDYSGKICVSLVAATGRDFLARLKSLPANEHPSIVLMDVDMPELSGIDTVLIAKAKYPQIQFIMLTVFDDEEKLFFAVKAGACGYLLKDEKISNIIGHIESAHNDNVVPMSPSIAQKTIELIKKSNIQQSEKQNHKFQLTKRELEVLQLMVIGRNYIEIGEDLSISKNTVKKHIAKVYEKLHVTSKAEAIRLVHFHNLF